MRKWTLFLGLYFAACMLAACASGGVDAHLPEENLPEFAPAAAGLSDLYLQVLDDLWKEDKNLNDDISLVGLDLTATSLTEGERSTVALLFGQRHSVEVLQITWEDLEDQGYIQTQDGFRSWEDGCFFAVSETRTDVGEVCFDAWKWRSALGAYYFGACTAQQADDGSWNSYTVGAEMIS